MDNVILGKTGIKVNKNGFGALPIQRITKKDAVYLLQKAFYNGIDYFDTARAYSDSEEKIGAAFEYTREKIIISTKTQAETAEGFWKDLEESLRKMKTDYIDIYQFHNPSFCPRPGDESGLYDAALEAKKQGKIRHIGITNHRIAVAREAIGSGLYETLQFPFSYLAADADLKIVEECKDADMGFIAAYLINGQNLSVEQIQKDFLWRDIKVAQGEFDSGVLIMWRINPLWTNEDQPHNSNGGYIINPLNWRTDDTVATADLNLGANIFDSKAKIANQVRHIPGFCGARINPETASLELSIAKQYQYIVDTQNSLNLNGFGFFAYNIVQNAERRMRTYKFVQQWK